jgi:hypothetical protein
MSDETITDPFGDEWDLGEVLAERAQPTDTVTIFLNEAASYAKAQLLKALSKGGIPPEEREKMEDQIAEWDKQLDERKYVIHLTAVPSRMREDIQSKALSEHPIKPNLLGQDDPLNARARMIRENELIWLAQITKVVNPVGKVKAHWTEEEMRRFSESLPSKAQDRVDKKIKELTAQAEEYTVRAQNLDFS